jgi:hypothetical protein
MRERADEVVESEVKPMTDTPGIITDLCDADNYTKEGVVRMGREAFTVSDLEEIKNGGRKDLSNMDVTPHGRRKSGSNHYT